MRQKNIMDRMMQLYSNEEEQIQKSGSKAYGFQEDFDQINQDNNIVQQNLNNRLSMAQASQVFQDKIKVIKTQQIIPTPLTQIEERKINIFILDGLVEQTKKLLKTSQNLSFRIQVAGLNWDVRRSDQDFNILHKYLQKIYPHIIIPAISQFKGQRKFDTKFIMKRGRILEKFLKQCLRSIDIKACQAFVQFLSLNDKKDYEALVKAMDKEIGAQSISQLVTQSGEIHINESQYQHFIKENSKYQNCVRQFEGGYRRIYQQMKRLGSDLQSISQTVTNIHESVEQLSQVHQNLSPERDNQQGFPALLSLLAKAMNLWSQSYLNQKTVLNDNIIQFFQYYSLYGEQIQEFYAQIQNSLDDINKKDKALTDTKEKLFTNKDISTWKLKDQPTPEQVTFLQKNKNQAFALMLPKETQDLQEKKDLFSIMVQSFKFEITRNEEITYGELKQQLEDLIEPVVKSYHNHLMIWQQFGQKLKEF